MIRFVDLRPVGVGGRFAFFDTVMDRFVTVGDDQIFENIDELLESYALGGCGFGLDRLRGVLPAWVYEKDDDHNDEQWEVRRIER